MTAALSIGAETEVDGVGAMRGHEVRRADEARELRARGAKVLLRSEDRELRVADLHDAVQRIRNVRGAGIDLGDRDGELLLRERELRVRRGLLSLAGENGVVLQLDLEREVRAR